METEAPLEATTKSEFLPGLTFQTTVPPPSNDEDQSVPCVKCEKVFKFPTSQDDYLAHLFLAHRLVIADVADIALLEEYLKFWRKEFENHPLEEYCTTMLLDQLPDGTPAKNEKYYLLSDVLPKDFELRANLKKQRLEKALAQHQFELTDRTFSRECLYCRDVITGLRSSFLEHLFTKHFLQLGKPENLIYIDELLAKVQHNLENLICLYCEKVFKDRVTLKEHMRKKAHKRINPNNKTYDKYFLENYKIPDTTKGHNHQQQKRVQKKPKGRAGGEQQQPAQQQRSAIKDNSRSSSQQEIESVDFERFAHHSEDSDSDWSDWNGEGGVQPITCLYCPQKVDDFQLFKKHLSQTHSVDFDKLLEGLNFYQKIKIVNYVRRQMCLLRCVTCDQRFENQDLLLQHLQEEQHFGVGTRKQWDKPEYFFPTYEDDGLLCTLDDNPNDDMDETVVRIISEDPVAQINKDAEKLSLENFNFL
ncbi:zinc finger protein 277 [Musca vetustissima]|uniref:zinc finger protein 277 n=1 Tax=Musca vetustissima TaxID=27455 RepID=UPI002AB64A36|nr:zinc finger protein 277 [Musca vetustissima]